MSCGVYLPFRRLERQAVHAANRWFAGGLKTLAHGTRSIANWDEDAVTMAVEAARACLDGMDRSIPRGVTLASVTHPFADRSNAGLIKEALTLPDDVVATDAGGSMRAATLALRDALEGSRTRLVIGSDLRKSRIGSEGEMLQGDGAAAILVGHGEPIARLIASHSLTIDFIDHFRRSGTAFDYQWESRWVREKGYMDLLAGAVATLLKEAGLTAGDIDHAVLPISDPAAFRAAARAIGLRPEAVIDTLGANVGDIGCGHPLLMLASALERAGPGERILVTGFGQGADTLLFETTEAVTRNSKRGVARALSAGKSDDNYMRFLFHRGLIDMDRGIRAELDQKQPGTTLYRKRSAVLGLVGSKCGETGVVQFPPSAIAVDPNGRFRDTQSPYPLADRIARIISYTADALGYSPDPPTYYGTLDFEGGGRIVTEFAEVGPEDVEVGRAMRMVFRIKADDEQRGFTKYFWKAVPAQRGEG
ncbi:3-oxoacyl-[acyl-carrier-protein] synthase III C-terminal domain-containing protein [Sphingobium jiangsuense]|uniref:3-oxoacyl-[acyl-carrier-protein] synthase III C-terminal domain-containing protein n=1 Tax=Sphingobium jiangsuense TaxID=870476 RepID=UPI001FEC0544|nr:3-oxoacyl-[acyl-carrier-protein] synthase III C-terminal domain-containing protein [Sphingobium jiangsuense]